MESQDVASQLAELSIDSKAQKKMGRENKPRKPRKKKTATTQKATPSSFQHSQDQHAAFPRPASVAQPPIQQPQTYADPGRAPSAFQSINRHPSTFFTPSAPAFVPSAANASHAHASQQQQQQQDHKTRYTQLTSLAPQHQSHPDPPSKDAPNVRRSSRLANTLPSQPGFFTSLAPPLPTLANTAPRDEATPDPEVRPFKPSDRRARRVGALLRPQPTSAYNNKSQQAPHRLEASKRLLVVLDLNGVLVHRRKRSRTAYVPRPGLNQFLDYLFENHNVMVWSSGMPKYVETIVQSILPSHHHENLVTVWARDTLRLPSNLFTEKVQVYKQLSWIWQDKALREKALQAGLDQGWNQNNTVLIDDSSEKAAAEPCNLVQVDEFTNANGQDKNKTLLDVIEYLERIRWYADVSAAMRETPFKQHDE